MTAEEKIKCVLTEPSVITLREWGRACSAQLCAVWKNAGYFWILWPFRSMFLRSFGQRHAGVDVLTLLQTVRWTNCCKNLWCSNPPTYHPPPPIVSRLFDKYFPCLKNAEKLILQSGTKCYASYVWLTFTPQSNNKPTELCMFAFFQARKSHECVSIATCKRMVSLNIVSFLK